MRIYYLTHPSFFQVDSAFLHEMAKENEITLGMLYPLKNANYSLESISKYCRENNIELEVFRLKHRYSDLRITGSFIKLIFGLLKQKADIIYIVSQDHPVLNVLTYLLPRNKVIFGIHDVEFHSNFKAAQFFKVGRAILMWGWKRFIVFSENQGSVFKKLYPQKEVYAIPLPLSDYGPVPLDLSKEEKYSCTNFLFFGNIVDYKGLDTVIEAVNILGKKYKNFTMTIAGRCSDWESKYLPMIDDLRAYNLNIGFIENEEVKFFFSEAHYLLLPYKDATQSGPLMIAFNYGVPVIASDIDGFREFINDGIDGVLFDGGAADLVSKMEEAIGRSYKSYTEMSELVLKRAKEEYLDIVIARSYEKVFTHAL